MAAKKKTQKKNVKSPSTAASVRVRMYRSGLGDCFLLTFPRKGAKPCHMLVDCGVFFQSPNEKQRMRDIAADIKAATHDTIDVLVATHEHYDHLIGFKHAKDIFAGMTIKQVWLSWTEKPGDPRAAWLRAIENKLKLGLQLALQQAMKSPAFSASTTGLRNVLQFGGNPLAADYSEQLGEVKRWLRDDITSSVQFLEPHGDAIEIVPGVRVYPLGPPIKESFFRRMNDSKKDPQTYQTHFALSAVPAFSDVTVASNANQPFTQQDVNALAQPFESRWQIAEKKASSWRTPLRPEQQANASVKGEAFFAQRYGFKEEDANAWRRIDDNWLAEAENLALQLDSLTNNSSLALAIEVGSARRVILMAADAQVGNWLSWHEGTWKAKSDSGTTVDVMAEDLLGRTVLYKVGHHGSHNATLKARGLELMTSEELVAMIPVDQPFANNVKGWEMPFPGLLTALTQRTKGRVIRADVGLPTKSKVASGARTKFFAVCSETALFCDYLVPM
ncbi:MAG: hypothetical protein ACT4R6_03500 [Gemmatimonadaceae bacterium]